MMKTFTAALALVLSAATAGADPAGLRPTKIDMPHHGHRTGMAIWYPNGGGGDRTIFAENGVFQGIDAAIWAGIAPGKHPVVLFSHGMGGSYRAQSWLAAGLAERGAIVLAVNHPNSTWTDFDMSKGVRHWTRAQDLTTALDAVIADPAFADHLDLSRVMAAGFSFGGWTALSLGGIRGNHAGIVARCRENTDALEACDMLLSPRVNVQGIDSEIWNADYSDARVRHVVAIDPGLVWGLEAADVAGLVPTTTLIGFGSGADRMLATDFDTSGLATLMPAAHKRNFDPAFHFTAMPLCKPEGAAILEAERDDPVCTDPEGTDRAAIHGAIIDLLAKELGL